MHLVGGRPDHPPWKNWRKMEKKAPMSHGRAMTYGVDGRDALRIVTCGFFLVCVYVFFVFVGLCGCWWVFGIFDASENLGKIRVLSRRLRRYIRKVYCIQCYKKSWFSILTLYIALKMYLLYNFTNVRIFNVFF